MEYFFYKIACKDVAVQDVYVGSTRNIDERLKTHRKRSKNLSSIHGKALLYRTIREHGGFENWSHEVIETKVFSNKKDALFHERDLVNELKANLNAQDPIKSKDETLQYKKEYRQQNKEQIKEYNKQYKSVYRQQNREKINEHNTKLVSCVCGSTYQLNGKARHERSKKHQHFIESQK